MTAEAVVFIFCESNKIQATFIMVEQW